MNTIKSILILTLLVPTFTYAQHEANPYIFKMSPQHLATSIMKVGIERLNSNQTKSFSLYLFGSANDSRGAYAKFPYTGGGAEIQARKYLNTFATRTNARGQTFAQSVYLAGFAQGGVFQWINDESDNVFVKRKNFDKNIALGFTIGFQRTFWKVLVIDGFVGGGFQIGWSEASDSTPMRYMSKNKRFSGPGYTGILPKAGLQIGVTI